jgi:superfamily II DNA/RNA helicase
MENVFGFRNQLIAEYSSFSRSFSRIRATDISNKVEQEYKDGRYWPEPLIQINPNYRRICTVQELAAKGEVHAACAHLFKAKKTEGTPVDLHLYAHQVQALAKAGQQQSYVVTTGTGSGKSLSFFIPIVDRILKAKEQDPKPRTRAIVIYPMNALANSQLEELDKFLHGYPHGQQPFTVARYTGQEGTAERERIKNNPPDILLTNFMMLELILTRHEDIDRGVVEHCHGLEFLVLDELHTYRGRQGADVALLVRRLRERLQANNMVCIGTSATMSSTGTLQDRNKTVADVASRLFGTTITENDIIGETLDRVTNPSKDVKAVKPYLKAALTRSSWQWKDFHEFQDDPLAIWVELNLGIEYPADEAPRRAKPLTLNAAAEKLVQDAGCDFETATQGLQAFLVAAHEVKTEQGRPPFAFKLHQFISGPGKVLSTLEPAGVRHITLDAQRFAPGRQDEGVRLYPVHFCRECGQEYHPVWRSGQSTTEFGPREIDDISSDEDEDASYGFLCPQTPDQTYKGELEDLPEAWLDLSKADPKVKPTFRKSVPQPVSLSPTGLHGHGGQDYWFIPGKFRFCLNCGQTHEVHGKDINRLSSLSGEGRSSATTILTLTAIRQLFAEGDPEGDQPDPRKLLGFTDNRQDAALQAGHFNDFIFLLTLRAALIGALQNNQGLLTEENIASEVFKTLGFEKVDAATLTEYLRNPGIMGLARQEAQKALRFIMGYRLLRDLRRGWRFNNPNLDQLNLLRIRYRALDEFAAEETLFAKNPVLSKLSPPQRAELATLMFDYMRRGLCLQTVYLDSVEQERAKTTAFQYLNERWAFASDEILETSRYLILGKRPEYRGRARTDLITGGARTRLLRDIKSATFWKDAPVKAQTSGWKDPQWTEFMEDLLKAAANYGYAQKFDIDTNLLGWRLNASSMDWLLVRDEQLGDDARHNAFFRNLYLAVSQTLQQSQHALFDFEAQEHTAQVDADRRQTLEQRFRYTAKDRKDWSENPAHEAPLQRLPVMFCSPTMELGVDISALNAVYLRNVPPTPANYAQRSGRAGRSGMQALVITYCAALSPHDQWFFHHADQMVHGIVRAPTLDLANKDLVESHLHAIWLASAQVQLDTSIAPMLDLEAEGQPLKADLLTAISSPEVKQRAAASAQAFMKQLHGELAGSPWFSDDHALQTVESAPTDFAQSFDRWRTLVKATRQQMDMANAVTQSFTSTNAEKTNAQRRYGDAARQYAVLLKAGNGQNNDFYTYRYLASQGFLPGYNFPRLPLMAWIPARGGAGGKDDEGSMVSRPRFLALSEFGPRSLIYHQGRMYRVVRAKLNAGNADHISGNSQLATLTSRVCSACGYAHMGIVGGAEPIVDRCENCDALLTDQDWVKNLYRIETVETVPVERISINDEDRQRQGFELQTTYRFLPGKDGKIASLKTQVLPAQAGEPALAELTYAPAALIWRINRGWRRRKDKNQLGFYINPVTGQWSKKDEPGASEAGEPDEGLLDKVPNQQIVPYVEDYRNILILQPAAQTLDKETMATLQAALKRGIEMTYQIEESELVAEPLPTQDNRQAILFYEAAEGGAGVLTRLASEPQALAQVAVSALKLLHYNEPQGPWRYEDLPALEQTDKNGHHICEAGCYQCLLSYFNQPDHDHINRRNEAALKLLAALANAQVVPAPAASATMPLTLAVSPDTSAVTSDSFMGQWLAALDAGAFQRPEELSPKVAGGAATAAGHYKTARLIVFLEQPSDEVVQNIRDKGRDVLVMSDPVQWPSQFAAYPQAFGLGNTNHP